VILERSELLFLWQEKFQPSHECENHASLYRVFTLSYHPAVPQCLMPPPMPCFIIPGPCMPEKVRKY